MRLRRSATIAVALAVVVGTAAPGWAGWQPEQPVTTEDPAVTAVSDPQIGTAADGSAVATWLEWHGADGAVMAARRPVDGAWGPSIMVDDATERAGVTGGRLAVTDLAVLPGGDALISYQEYDADAEADFVGRVVRLHADDTVTDELSRPEQQWHLIADAEGDWLATAREYDHCACENATWYSDGGSAPELLGTYPGLAVRFALSRHELVYLAVDDDDGLLGPTHTLRVLRIDATSGVARTPVLLKPSGPVRGFDIDTDSRDDAVLAWSVRNPGPHRPDLVRVTHRRAGHAWSSPHTVARSHPGVDRPIGGPQVELDGTGNGLVVWSSPRRDAGRVDLESVVVRPTGRPGPVQRLAGRIAPGSRTTGFDVQVNDAGRAVVAFRHRGPCAGDPASTCSTVSAVVGPRPGRLTDPRRLFSSPTPFASVALALSDAGPGIVLALESGSTRLATRTSP